MDSTLQDLSIDTKNSKIGVQTKKLCKFQYLKKISKHCSTFSRRGYCILTFSDIILDHIDTSHIFMDSTLQELSNGTKNTQIGVRMTKLWPYKVEEKNRGLQPRRDVRNDVATWQRASETTSRREKRRRDVAESCRNDVATSPNDVATFGVGFGWIFSPF